MDSLLPRTLSIYCAIKRIRVPYISRPARCRVEDCWHSFVDLEGVVAAGGRVRM
jgi:hypothetical protein